MNHKNINIAIKQADIDVEIIPLINYLNSFEGIITRWSCQGDLKPKTKGQYYLPYVTFIAEDFISFKKLLEHLNGAPCEVVAEHFNELITMWFSIRFASKEHLKVMLKWVKKHNH